jgi:DHA1 family multidrug resistance protein-like MFS transporter
VALIAVPMPVIFFKYGKKIRAKSKFAPAPDIEQDKKRDEESKTEGSGSDGTNGNEEKVKKRTE